MEFKGTIVITDPCYFAKDCDWDESGNFDYESCTIHGLGFSDYIWMPTEIGDGSWSVFGLDELTGQIELEKHVNKVLELESALDSGKRLSVSKNELQNLQKKETVLGQFGVDSGTFGVFYLDEVLEYNPSFLSDIGNWCYTVIPDFKGNIDVLECNEDRDFVILGVGNKTFYTR